MQEIIDEISNDFGLDNEFVTKIVRSQYKFVKDVMEAGEMDSIHLPYFGKIAVKPKRIEYLDEDFLSKISKSGISFKK